MKNPKWKRYRFVSNEPDHRPVIFPPPGPYWCSGYDSDDNAILIAYLPEDESLEKYWPEAGQVGEVDYTIEESITYTDRFSKPDWYKGNE